MNYGSMAPMDAAETAIDEETLHALLEHLNEAPTGAELLSGTGLDATRADGAPAAAAATTTGAFFSVLSSTHTKNEPGATVFSSNEDVIPDYALPEAQYIERTILPLLLRGLEEVAQVRPPDPLAFLGAYMICNNPQKAPAATAADGVGASGQVGSGERDGAASWPAGSTTMAERLGSVPLPALGEAVQQAMSRFATGKGNAAGKSTTSTAPAAGAGGALKSP